MSRLYLVVFCLLLNVRASISETTAEKECEGSREATVIYQGKEVFVEQPESPFETKQWGHNNDQVYYALNEEKRVYYVPNFLNATTATELQGFCDGRFVKSPIRGNMNGDQTTQLNEIRTSESCVLVPAAIYLSNPRFLEMRKKEHPTPQEKEIFRVVDVTWEVSRRAALLLSRDPTTVEPLQLVRYTSPDAYYNVHHDHGQFYGKTTEHRPWTVLVFLNDVSSGGHTWFPKLDLKVAPRAGDAIAWSNVDEEGKADGDMVHAGQPPGKEGVEKYAMNIWLGDSPMEGTNPALVGGKWGDSDSNS